MVTTRLYLDARHLDNQGEAPIKIQINKRCKTALLATGIRIKPEQWDKATLTIVRHPNKGILNTRLAKIKIKVDETITNMVLSGKAAPMTALDIKNELATLFNGDAHAVTFGDYAARILAGKTAQRTLSIYRLSYARMESYAKGTMAKPMASFTPGWIEGFIEWMKKHYSDTTIKITMGNLSSAFIMAVKDGTIRTNPCADVKLRPIATRKRNLSQAKFRLLWNAVPQTESEAAALDMFKFSFLTIAMNPVDMFRLTEKNIYNGRIEYTRSKTGKSYSIKIVDELEPLLRKYSKGGFLVRPFDTKEYDIALIYFDKLLTRIAHRVGIQENVTMYWARHTFATMAAELDIPVDIIASALGHSHGVRVTMVYVAIDQKKVDDAARKVYDYALYE